MQPPVVSVVIPTYNRRDDVLVAARCAAAQTYPAEALEILVVDDGGRDDTADALARAFGDRVRYLWKPNGGVSSARNHGMARARGELIALLDSDDEWLPTKIERQVARFAADPRLGMVLTDVQRMTSDRVTYEIWERRAQLPVDGWVLAHVLRNPSLIPSAAMIRREVFERTGGFDEGLRTAEDLDFHLRVATAWSIALVEEPLTRWMRGHDEGLSSLVRTYYDYLYVVERFVREHGRLVGPEVCDAALIEAYVRNARGLLWIGEVSEALRCGVKGARRTRRLGDVGRLAALGAVIARGLAVHVRRRVAGA